MQLAIVIAIVSICAALTLRRVVLSVRGKAKKTACGCAECPAVERRQPTPSGPRAV